MSVRLLYEACETTGRTGLNASGATTTVITRVSNFHHPYPLLPFLVAPGERETLFRAVFSFVRTMVPFFFLHAEIDTKSTAAAVTYGRQRPVAGTCLSLFGKDGSGESVALHIRGYRIHFFASFSDARLGRHCCTRLLQREGRDNLVASVESVSGFKSMLIDKKHQTASAEDYADTTLRNLIRIQVRTVNDVAATIAAIRDSVREYYTTAGGTMNDDHEHAARFYNSNFDTVLTAVRRLGLDPCRWTRLNTALCRDLTPTDENDAGAAQPCCRGRLYEFYDTGAVDPSELFVSEASPIAAARPPPLVKVMSFDIECLSSDAATMPAAVRDPIIQISTVVSSDAMGGDTKGPGHGANDEDEGPLTTIHSFRRHLYTTGGTCDRIPGVAVHAFSHEKHMLRAFVDHVAAEDPDIITGYNVFNFDFPYLFERLETNDVAALLGRARTTATCRKRRNGRGGRQYASFIPKTHDTRVPGRVIFDMYTHVRKEFTLRTYTLNSVSAHFLDGRKKEDIDYRQIPRLFNGDDKSRAHLGRYCVKDAQLVLEVAFQTQTFVHAFEQCKVFRTTLQYMIDRGQQVRFYSLLLAWCSLYGILVDDITTGRERPVGPTVEKPPSVSSDKAVVIASERRHHQRKRPYDDGAEDSEDDTAEDVGETAAGTRQGNVIRGGATAAAPKSRTVGYDGATVLEPISGIYYTPVVCLDYASLYPSIMIAYNLCFTTFVADARHAESLLRSGSAERSPIGHHFLTRDVKKGVLPSILEMLMEERAAVRKRMTTDVTAGTLEYRMLDGQQSALKIAANSIYGAIGCVNSVLNIVEIPSSVTAYGRRLIALTKHHAESNYEGARVIYGDTDSVMVNLERWDSSVRRIWECAAIGREMAASTTRIIARHPIRLQFETVYRPFLLCTKKRYAAGVYNDLDRMAAAAADGTDETAIRCCPTLKYKGLQVVRRDNCTFATRLMRFVLETLMDERGDAIGRVTDGLRAELARLFAGRVNMKELVISKEWKTMCKNAQAHDTLARRMRERDPNSAPQIGDRVPYVIVTVPRGAKLCDRAEDPLYVMEHGLSPDYMYYAENQVAKPVAELLRVVLPERGGSPEEIKDLFWPSSAPTRKTDRRQRRRYGGEKCWMKKASSNNRRLTDSVYRFTRTTGAAAVTLNCTADECARELADVEDILDGLAAKCVSCKNNDVEAIRSCRDRECETLYERFGQLELRRRASNGLKSAAAAAVEIGSGSNDETKIRFYEAVFAPLK